jgi:hypothetical protein
MAIEQVEESTVMDPIDEALVMKPMDNILDGDEDVVFRTGYKQSSLKPVPAEDESDSAEDDRRDQEEVNSETEEHTGDTAHEKFERELKGTPEVVEVESESLGVGIRVDYIVFIDKAAVENPHRNYNGGLLELQRGGTITFSFADCHTKCDEPDAIRSVYLVDGDADDNTIIGGNVNNGLKAIFEQTDPDSFKFRVPDGVTYSDTPNKLVIETRQTDEISAFYIQDEVEIIHPYLVR